MLTIITAVVTVAFLVVLATNVAPWLRGPKAWRWPYAIPGTWTRLWLPAVLLVLYAVLAVWLVRKGRDDPGRDDPGRDNPAPTRDAPPHARSPRPPRGMIAPLRGGLRSWPSWRRW